MKPFTLSIVTIVKESFPGQYLAQDVFTGEDCQVRLSGKLHIHLVEDLQLKEGDQVMANFIPSDSTSRRMVIENYMKGIRHSNSYEELVQKYKERYGPYNGNALWIRRAVK